MNLRKTLAVMRKEWVHITRDPRTFFLVTVSPVFLLTVLGYAFSVDIKNVSVAVMDHDRTALSRAYIAGIHNSSELDVCCYLNSWGEIRYLLDRSKARAVVVIPPGFADDLQAGRPPSLQIIVDGTDPNTGQHALTYLGGYTSYFVADQIVKSLGQSMSAPSTAIDLRIRTWYNPAFKSVIGMVPALIAVVLAMPAMSVALTLAREKEWGTLEQLITTPLRRSELLIGKLLPYIASGLVSVVLCTLVGILLFGVPFRGSFPLFLLLSSDFFLASLSLGLLMSVFIGSQQVAMIVALLVFLFPGFFLSGLIFPISAMPPEMRLEAYSVPTTHYVTITRGIFLKGAGLGILWPFALTLFVMGVILTLLTVLLFRKRLT
ncbi:MAG: ABC transporter permease [Anaerolineae bacterium]|nr:ABC transporter permease [Anaerolineae bacterium]